MYDSPGSCCGVVGFFFFFLSKRVRFVRELADEVVGCACESEEAGPKWAPEPSGA